MTWTLDLKKSAAMATLNRLATKYDDPLQDDMKVIADRAAQDADTVVTNLSNERMLADLYHQSDKSKGLDKDSEFYKAIQKYAKENFERSKPQLDTILSKYQEKDELASITGAYYKAFEDQFYAKVSKAWQELRPSQTINPLPAGGQAAPGITAENPATAPAPVPELAPATSALACFSSRNVAAAVIVRFAEANEEALAWYVARPEAERVAIAEQAFRAAEEALRASPPETSYRSKHVIDTHTGLPARTEDLEGFEAPEGKTNIEAIVEALRSIIYNKMWGGEAA